MYTLPLEKGNREPTGEGSSSLLLVRTAGKSYKKNPTSSPSSQASGVCQEVLQPRIKTGTKGGSEHKAQPRQWETQGRLWN